ncbi:baseplate J/gp47 family protein [Candidatus Pacearchaeota archaeon]|nr:baseplate J/gp47 family protein [Candidatus Pacearchaeota archaeon]
MSGLDANGLTIKRLADIKTEIEASLRNTFGNQINTLPQSVIGQLIGVFSEREALIWELVEAIYGSQYPDSAEGVSLDDVGAITSFTRLAAIESRIIGQVLIGTATTVIPIGTLFSVDGDPTSIFSTLAEVVLTAGVDEVQNIEFSATPTNGTFKLVFDGETTAAINWDDTNTEVQTVLNNLSNLSGIVVTGSFAADFVVTFDSADGNTPQNLITVADNTLDAGGSVTVTITETTAGEYQGTVDMTAPETGPIIANANTLTVIDTPISGLTSTFNPEDAEVGGNIESDSEFRIRRNNRLQISLAGPLEAIKTAILVLNDIEGSVQLEDVRGFENVEDITDARGIPAHAFEMFVFQAGAVTTRDQEIRQAIFDSKPAGIKPHGDVSGTVTDSQGFDHTIKFSRPTEVDIYLELDLTVTSDYPADGDDQVKAVMILWGDALGTGQDVIIYPSLVAQLDSIPGITDVVIRIKDGVGPTTDDNIVIDDGITPGIDVEISRWDTSRITITQI